MDSEPQCVMILSTKSAGSSAVQELIRRFAGARLVSRTRHAENETLYWTKAASILGMPQVRMPDSEVPIARELAQRELVQFLGANVPGFAPPGDPRELVFAGWRQLCARYAPLFLEKSPHHLHQRAALELILEAVRLMPDVDFRFVGLVRNPMDVLYSAWCRWRTNPREYQHHWRMAHENLRWFAREAGERLCIVRYEDLVSDAAAVRALFGHLGRPADAGAGRFLRRTSLLKWKSDPWFSFQLDPRTRLVARSFGYTEHELLNEGRRVLGPLWPAYRICTRIAHRAWVHGPQRRLLP